MNETQAAFAGRIGANIRAFRGDLSREELAERAGVTKALIRNAEQGANRLTLDNAFAIADALGVTVDALRSHKRPVATPGRGRPKGSKR